MTVENQYRLARSEVAGRPTLNQRHRRVNLSSTLLGDQRSPTRPANPPDGVPRLEGSAVRQSNLGKVFKVENNSLELTRIFKESFKDQR